MGRIQDESGIGRRLRASRERLGWNRETLAFHSGISWSAVAQVESGRRRNLRPGTLSRLARALGVTIDYLVAGRPVSESMFEHRAVLYASEPEFLNVATPYLLEAVEHCVPTLAVMTSENIRLLTDQLGRSSGAIRFVERSRWYRTPVAALNGYREFINDRIDDGAPWVRIVGEPVWSGRSASEVMQWARYESLLNLALGNRPVTVLCPYDTREVSSEIVGHARATHPHTVEHDLLAASSEYTDPSAFVLAG